jgi:hypothetical protein
MYNKLVVDEEKYITTEASIYQILELAKLGIELADIVRTEVYLIVTDATGKRKSSVTYL